MDPLTQGLLGAAAAQASLQRRVPESIAPKLWWLGALGGMAADLDILIRAPGDPMVALTFHRHFTHSLAFVPIGGLLVALPFALRALPEERRSIAAATTVGYATHALLDAFTSYGTMLWWPFADTRVAWNTISIIDPIYTLVLALGVWLAKRRLSGGAAQLALLLSSLYMAACFGQRQRVDAAHAKVVAQNPTADGARYLFPGLLANTRWRALAVYDDHLVATGVAAPWFGPVQVREGDPMPRFHVEDAPNDMVAGPGGARVREALTTLNWFAGERLYIEDQGPGWWRVCDARYSLERHAFAGLFCWRLEPGNPDAPVRQEPRRGSPNDARALAPWSKLEGYGPPP